MDPEGNRFEAEIIYGDDYSGWFRPVGEEDMTKWYSLNKGQYQEKLAKYMARQEKLVRIDEELGLDNADMDAPMYSTPHNGGRADVSAESAGSARQQDGYMLAAGGSRDKDSGGSGREKEKRGNKAGGEGNGKKKGLSGTAKAKAIVILIVLAVILCILKAVSNMASSGSSSSGQESQTEAEADPDATYSVAVWACSKSAGDTVEEGDFQTVSFSGTVYASLLEGGTPVLEEDIEGLYGLTLASDVTEGSTAYSSQINAAEDAESADGTMTIKIYADITYSDGTVEEGVLIGEYSAEGGTDIEAYAEISGSSGDNSSDTEEDDDDGSDAAEDDSGDDETSAGVGEIELN